MSANHERIKNDPRWKQAREDCLERDGYACVECGSSESLEVDHIIPLELEPELAFELENLQTLCRPCHIEKGREKQVLMRNTWINPRYEELIAVGF